MVNVTSIGLTVTALGSAASNSVIATPASTSFSCALKQDNPNCGIDGNPICCPNKPLPIFPVQTGIEKRLPNWKPEDLPRLCPERCHEYHDDGDCLIPCLEGLPTKPYRYPKFIDHSPCVPINRDVDCTKRPEKWCCRDHVYQRDVSPMDGFTSRVNVSRANEMNLYLYTPTADNLATWNSSSKLPGNDSAFAAYWHGLAPTTQHDMLDTAGYKLKLTEALRDGILGRRTLRAQMYGPPGAPFNLDDYATVPADSTAWASLRRAMCETADKFDSATAAELADACGIQLRDSKAVTLERPVSTRWAPASTVYQTVYGRDGSAPTAAEAETLSALSTLVERDGATPTKLDDGPEWTPVTTIYPSQSDAAAVWTTVTVFRDALATGVDRV